VALALTGGVLIAALGGAAGAILVLQPWSHPVAAVTPTPSPSPAPSPTAGELPIVPSVDCTGSAPTGFSGAADQAVCTVLTPLGAMDEACAASEGTACESAARQLSQAAGSALQQVEAQTPVGSAEKTASSDLRSSFKDYATAGNEIASGIDDGNASLVTKGMDELSAASAQLTAGGAALSG